MVVYKYCGVTESGVYIYRDEVMEPGTDEDEGYPSLPAKGHGFIFHNFREAAGKIVAERMFFKTFSLGTDYYPGGNEEHKNVSHKRAALLIRQYAQDINKW